MAIILAVQINQITGNLTYQLPQKCDKYISFRVKVNGSTSGNNKLYFRDTNNKTFGLHFYNNFSVYYDDSIESNNFGNITNFPTEIVVNMLLGNTGSVEVYRDNVLVHQAKRKIGENAPISAIAFTLRQITVVNFMVADFDLANYRLAIPKIDLKANDFSTDSSGNIYLDAAGKSLAESIDVEKLKEEMREELANPEIAAVGMSGINLKYDSTKVDQLQTSVNDIIIETMPIRNGTANGKAMLVNPVTGKKWTVADLKNATFKLTTMKG
nr:MAG TPA: hypothetical protein [Caudoviricetes sp.]